MKVNVYGFINKVLGLGNAARITIHALRNAKISCTAVNAPRHEHFMKISEDTYDNIIVEKSDAPINIIHMNPDALHAFYDKTENSLFFKKYNIGYWFWETDLIPEEWYYAFDLVDEIWVGSDYNYEVFKKACQLPIFKMPTEISIKPTLDQREAKLYFSFPDKFIFLACFDFNSSIKRKNPEAIVKAFKMAFPDDNDVCLVFKTQHAKNREDKSAEEFNKLIEGDSRIIAIDQSMTETEMANLKNACDCYVSLHRSEGLGLNIAEAMSIGKPVISTGYSGSMEFTNHDNAFLVDYKLISMEPGDYYCSSNKMHWAEPDIAHAAELMKNIYTNESAAHSVGAKAKQYIEENFNSASVQAAYKKRIQDIYSTLLRKEKTNV